MAFTLDSLLTRWHKMLGLHRQVPSRWHRARLHEELRERRLAKTCLGRLSETSDVLFSISRAAHDGFPICRRPRLDVSRTGLAYSYMLLKYTSRWGFYRTAAMLCGVQHASTVREVVNPGRDGKLEVVAARHGIDPSAFRRVGRRLRWVWPLLP